MAPEAVARGDRVELVETEGGYAIVVAGEAVGQIGIRQDSGAPLIECVTLDPVASRAGLGMEAVRVLAHHLAAAGHHRVDALADAANGLTVYFWLRLGFRPNGSDSPMRFTRDLPGAS